MGQQDKWVARCEDIQDVLTDYLTRELGTMRAQLVREHLRKCDACRGAALEIEEAMAALRGAGAGDDERPQLSDDRRRRILRAYRHPLMGWLERHHVWVSLVAALVVVLLAVFVARRLQAVKEPGPTDGWPVRVGEGGE